MLLVRGISSVVAMLVVLAVTVSLAFAVVGWVTSTTNSHTGGRGLIVVYPDSYLSMREPNQLLVATPVLHLHIANRGSDTVVEAIEVVGLGVITKPFYFLENDSTLGEAYQSTRGVRTSLLPGGANGWVIVELPATPEAGRVYTVKLYTRDGVVVVASLPVKPSP